MKRLTFAAAIVLLTACAHQPATSPSTAHIPAASAVAAFSAGYSGSIPRGWEPLHILRTRKATDYSLVPDEQGMVLQALADGASSALMHNLDVEPAVQPWLHWSWKIRSAVLDSGASPAERGSPVRLVLGFDGDKDVLPFGEQIKFETARLLTGHEFPYATLMYVWAEELPVGTVVPSQHSNRIRMVVADSGGNGVGRWQRFTRNIVEDFERAFGERPGRLLGIGVLTDSGPIGESVQAWYGDIRLAREPAPPSPEPGPRRYLSLGQGQ